MKFNIFFTAILGACLCFTGCKEEFAEINSNPTSITKPNILYLYTQSQIDFEASDYHFWFYNGNFIYRFSQAFVPAKGVTSEINRMGRTGGQGSQTNAVLRMAREIDYQMSQLNANEAIRYTKMRATLDPIIVYLGMFDTDVFGDMPFSEAARAKYTNPMLLTPKYDRMSEMYNNWLAMLDNSIQVLSKSNELPQISFSGQDIIYKGDITKWIKLANALKLKIAARLISQDKAKALKIAEEVLKYPILDGVEDAFVFNKGTQNSDRDQIYHFGNWISPDMPIVPNKDVVDFLVKNNDPRVRFFYTKNKYNSRVIQAFYDNNAPIPAYIEANVNSSMVAGKKTFISWKGKGEPWVRYYGIPTELNAANNNQLYGDYFDVSKWKLKKGDVEMTYTPYSELNEELIRGVVDFRLPVDPAGPVIEDNTDQPWYGMYMTASEVNLYLAEFKLLGANIPGSAELYFSKALELSVKEYDRIAKLNKIPYYGVSYTNYDPFDKSIDLVEGEIDAMLLNVDYQLTGTTMEKLEKVYLQQYLNFMLNPTDQFVNVRRSGVPKLGSRLIPWKNFIGNTDVPRRLGINLPTPTDLMYSIKIKSLKDQGLTGGTSIEPKLLNIERLWQDIGAPEFGMGPKQ